MGHLRTSAGVGISPAKSRKTPSKGSNTQVGSTAIWDGPHKPKGPFSPGSSSGKDGISLLAKNAAPYKPGPITSVCGGDSK
jgi:hypothetical protein|tara:strand:- start:2370 stop:2612 length:243 start_codon:yes stop_codon:yes gene_type:complete